MKKLLLLAILLLALESTKAQFFEKISNPFVNLTLNNPPLLGLKIDKVIFNPTQSECSDQVMDVVISDFIANNVEVIDRSNLDVILSEHNLNLSGYIDKSTAASIGEIIGPSALVTLKILRCETVVQDNLYDNVKLKDSETGQYYYRKKYISRTEAIVKASLQVTDLGTGRIFASQTFDYSPRKENSSFEGRVVAPSEYEVQEIAFGDLAFDIHKLFFYWSQPISLIYFNDKKCNLKEAFESLKASDLEGAYDQSLENVKYCINSSEKDKVKAHAYYNMGISYFINSEYESALNMFDESKSIKSNDIVTDAIVMCKKAQQLSLMATQFEERADMDAQAGVEASKAKQNSILKNDDILSLSTSGLPEALILQKIKTSDCKFDTSTDALLSLIDAGISENVIAAMMEK